MIAAPFALLTPVRPPLPKRPEPPIGSYFSAGELTWRRYRSGWFPLGCGERPVRQWPWLVEGYLDRWPDACEIAVPDPFAEPVQLPWQVRGKNGERVRVHGSDGDGSAFIDVTTSGRCNMAELSAADFRDLCRAVWAAANQADKDGS